MTRYSAHEFADGFRVERDWGDKPTPMPSTAGHDQRGGESERMEERQDAENAVASVETQTSGPVCSTLEQML